MVLANFHRTGARKTYCWESGVARGARARCVKALRLRGLLGGQRLSTMRLAGFVWIAIWRAAQPPPMASMRRNSGPLASLRGRARPWAARQELDPARSDRIGAGPGQQPQTIGPAPIVVTVTPVKRADFPLVLQSIGQVQAYNTVLVRARVDGQIMKIGFNEGQMVKQGDLLAQIDPRPFQAALDQAVAEEIAGRGQHRQREARSARFATLAKQDFATKQQLDTQNAMVLQLTASIAADAAAIDAARRSSTIRPSAPRSRAAPGSASSTRATSSTPGNRPASFRSHNCSRSPSSSPSRRNMCRASMRNWPRARPKSRSWTRRAISLRPDACRSATIRSTRHRDNPAQGGVRQQGQCALARVGGDDGLAARRGERRLDCPH